MKNKVAIIIAIIVGLISIIAIKIYISGATGAGQGGMVKVLTAKRPLNAGDTLKPGDCTVAELPLAIYSKATRSFITESEIGTYGGKKLTANYRAGDYISSLTFTTDVATGNLEVAPGMRAVTINVDDVSGVANNLKPDDHVDIVMVQRLVGPGGSGGGGRGTGGGGGSSFSGQPILLNVFRDVRVLIPGHHVTTYGVENAGSQSYSTVTVELKAEKATILAAERNFSQITLLLRSANDPDHEDISGVVGDSANIQDMIAKLQKKETGGTSGEETPSSETGREGSSPGLTP